MTLGPKGLECLGRQKTIAPVECARPFEMRLVEITRRQGFHRQQPATLRESVVFGGPDEPAADTVAMNALARCYNKNLHGDRRMTFERDEARHFPIHRRYEHWHPFHSLGTGGDPFGCFEPLRQIRHDLPAKPTLFLG